MFSKLRRSTAADIYTSSQQLHLPNTLTGFVENTGQCNSENRNVISDHRISFRLMLFITESRMYLVLKNKNKKVALMLMKSHVDTRA